MFSSEKFYNFTFCSSIYDPLRMIFVLGKIQFKNHFFQKDLLLDFRKRERERERVKYRSAISYTKLGGQYKQQNHQQKGQGAKNMAQNVR